MLSRGILGSGWTRSVSSRPFPNSSGWWWLISSVFLIRISCHKTTHANSYYGAWPGWAVSISVLPLTKPRECSREEKEPEVYKDKKTQGFWKCPGETVIDFKAIQKVSSRNQELVQGMNLLSRWAFTSYFRGRVGKVSWVSGRYFGWLH